jgi:hypothetical protein
VQKLACKICLTLSLKLKLLYLKGQNFQHLGGVILESFLFKRRVEMSEYITFHPKATINLAIANFGNRNVSLNVDYNVTRF